MASLPVEVSRETQLRLTRFAVLFDRWSARINLVSASSRAEFWDRHVADSLQLLRLAPDARHWADLGSGGGFPGLVIAIALADEAAARVDLIESNGKKAAFLKAAAAELASPARVHPQRIADRVPTLPVPEIVTARALAPLGTLLGWCAPWLAAGSRALFHKGRGYADELAECRALWHFDLVEHASAVAADSVVLDLSNVRRREPES